MVVPAVHRGRQNPQAATASEAPAGIAPAMFGPHGVTDRSIDCEQNILSSWLVIDFSKNWFRYEWLTVWYCVSFVSLRLTVIIYQGVGQCLSLCKYVLMEPYVHGLFQAESCVTERFTRSKVVLIESQPQSSQCILNINICSLCRHLVGITMASLSRSNERFLSGT